MIGTFLVFDLLLGQGWLLLQNLVQLILEVGLIEIDAQLRHKAIEGEAAVHLVVLVDPGHG